MKIPISLTFKFFDEQVTVKRKVDDMHIGETMEMYRGIMVPIFGEKPYEDMILSQAEEIKRKRQPNYGKKPSEVGLFQFIADAFTEEIYL